MLKIVIQTNADFTPKGKRSAKTVETSGRMGSGRQLRWYVGGRLYRRLPVTTTNADITADWLSSGSAG